MKTPLILLLGITLLTSACVVGPPVPAPGPGPGLVVAVGDRPYYNRGSYYVEHGSRYVWVNGHWARRHGRRVWVHGHYALRSY